MPERNGAATDVDLARVDGEELLSGLDDDGKRLIDFEQRDIFLCQPCLFQREGKCKRWCNGEVDRIGCCIRVG